MWDVYKARGWHWCIDKSCYADFGVEHAVPVNGLDSKAIESKLQELVEKGEQMPR